jgi:exonuclease III
MSTFSYCTRTRIGTWNVKTLAQISKLAQVCREMDRYRLEILGLSEVRWKGSGEFRTECNHHLLFSGGTTRNYGVGILLTKSSKKSLMTYNCISDRIIMARFRCKFRNISIIQCYAPTEVDDDEVKDAFYEQLESTTAKLKRSDIKIIIGDFNAKVGSDNKDLETIMGKQGLGNSRNNNGGRLIDFCTTHQLFIGGSKFIHRDIHKYTWDAPNNVTKNQIDHFLISKKFIGSLMDVKAICGADVFSDHQLLVGIVRLRPSVAFQHRTKSRRFNIHRLRDEEVVGKFTENLQSKLNNIEIHNTSWECITNIYKETAEQTLCF